MSLNHVIQSPEWGKFKTVYGTPAVRVENIQYTIHKVPFTSNYYAYCGKVNPFEIKWDLLEKSLKENNCLAINFDVPNVLKGSSEEKDALAIFTQTSEKSPKNTFAKFNILLDISGDDETILSKMHPKARYNIKYAQKKEVTVKHGETLEDFEVFYQLLKDTSERQKYYIHPRAYYKKIWELFYPLGLVHLVTAYYKDKPLSSWMLFTYQNVLYYPYGGSSTEYQNFFPNELVCWEAIKVGKALGCTTFDMWGAAEDAGNKNDPWFGFTNFKLKFGGRHVEYIDSFDFIINRPMYLMFNTANDLRWKLLKVLK